MNLLVFGLFSIVGYDYGKVDFFVGILKSNDFDEVYVNLLNFCF